MDDDRIDLSSLDPASDAERWEGLARQVAARALARRRSMTGLLASWARPALAAAAVIALVAWGAAIWRRTAMAPAPVGAAREDAALAVLSWASSGVVPEDALEVLEAVR